MSSLSLHATASQQVQYRLIASALAAVGLLISLWVWGLHVELDRQAVGAGGLASPSLALVAGLLLSGGAALGLFYRLENGRLTALAAQQAERLAAALQARDAVQQRCDAAARHLNHEIRTPLSGIVGMADMLHEAGLPPEQKRLAHILVNSAQQLLRLVESNSLDPASRTPSRPAALPSAATPLAAAAALSAAAPPADQAAPAAAKQILVVEDNAVNQMVVLGYLKKLGVRAAAVANGQEALDLLARRHFDLVLMDCSMPVMDGYETTLHIRHHESQGASHLPIVALTANATQDDEAKCRRVGMDDYITKPLKRETLQRVLRQWLN